MIRRCCIWFLVKACFVACGSLPSSYTFTWWEERDVCLPLFVKPPMLKPHSYHLMILFNLNESVFVTQLYLTLCNPMEYSLPGSSVHGILQARILEWVTIPFSRGSSWPRDRTQVSCITVGYFTVWTTMEALLFNLNYLLKSLSSNMVTLGVGHWQMNLRGDTF